MTTKLKGKEGTEDNELAALTSQSRVCTALKTVSQTGGVSAEFPCSSYRRTDVSQCGNVAHTCHRRHTPQVKYKGSFIKCRFVKHGRKPYQGFCSPVSYHLHRIWHSRFALRPRSMGPALDLLNKIRIDPGYGKLRRVSSKAEDGVTN